MKQCGATGCDTKIKRRHHYCMPCLSRAPRSLRQSLFDAKRYTGGKMLLQALNDLREWFAQYPKRKDQKMNQEQRNETVEIDAEQRRVTDKGIALWDGREKTDENGNQREVWQWVPKSKVTQIDDTKWEMPYWLAKEKGFI